MRQDGVDLALLLACARRVTLAGASTRPRDLYSPLLVLGRASSISLPQATVSRSSFSYNLAVNEAKEVTGNA